MFELNYDELVALVLRDVGHILHEIYTVYFPQETKAVKGNQGGMPEEATWKENEKCLFELFKEYDICPSLLNKGLVFQIYMHTKNLESAVYSQTSL